MADTSSKAALGVHGLDDITSGGLARGRLFLLEGSPGTGKTTIAIQFLMAGAAKEEPALYITLSETENELRASAESHVRERCQRSEAAWTALADKAQRSERLREEEAKRKAEAGLTS